MSTEASIAGLETGKLFSFGDWPNEEIPMVSVGVYTVWLGEQLLYVGYSGRNLRPHEIKNAKKAKGLMTRIKSHRSGLRGGDQFCIYVCDRFVVPKLDSEAIESLANGGQLLDGLTRRFVRQELSYRFITTDGSETARKIESQVRTGILNAGKPLLNPA
ncbi:MAG TPA: hypothetical protein DD471_00590 [Planctomycetes bacterium]|jgi:hypothetical protein|nr:hypothetical protein [Planctomycetota bacterium]|tara:strand:- start:62 stop:538 length:477 start_codon:yes stop_codon:yes gene_type:complete